MSLFLMVFFFLTAVDFVFYEPKHVRSMTDEQYLEYFKRRIMGM